MDEYLERFKSDLELLERHQDRIEEVYEKEGIRTLAAKGEYHIDGIEVVSLYHESMSKCDRNKIDLHEVLDDLITLSGELAYHTANLFLYRRYLNDPLNQSYVLNHLVVYPIHENWCMTKYYMFANAASQALYNIWERFAKVLWSNFPIVLNKNGVYFHTVMDKLTKLEGIGSGENLSWITEFAQKDYANFNQKRKRIVHHCGLKNAYRKQHLDKGVYDESIAKELFKEQYDLAEYFKQQSDLTIEGFKKIMWFLKENQNKL